LSTDSTGPQLSTEVSPLEEVVAGLQKIPPIPQSVHDILQQLDSAVSSAHLVGDILSSDPAIGAALVRVVNSAAMGIARRIPTVHEAVSFLGFSTVRGMILRMKLAGLFPPPKARRHCYDTAELWVHSTAVSAVADVLAKRVNQTAEFDIDPALASTLGLFHDVGRLAVNTLFPAKVADLRPQKKARGAAHETLLARERRIFGADHAFIGGLLAAHWQLPEQLAVGIRLHHLPAGQALDSLALPLYRAVVLVHIADQLVKLKHVYCDDMPCDVIPESLFTALNLPPSLDDLLDQSVCTAIAQATAISHELSALPKQRKRLSA
jgi:HD-like signal output (HDOD) protein